MEVLDLSGQWTFRKENETETFPATVPGCIHTDLLALEKIEDPFYRDNENKQTWIAETDWIYIKTFYVSNELMNSDRIILRCEGLDTLATIIVNSKKIATTNNQFRTWEFDIKENLYKGNNLIEIFFNSTLPLISEEQKKHYLNLTGVGHHRIEGSNYIRKNQSNYGWDWGPICVTAGIWRPILLLGITKARLSNIHITQDHTQQNKVKLDVNFEVEKTCEVNLRANINISYNEKLIKDVYIDISEKSNRLLLEIENPELWWPNGMGDQSLYNISITLYDNNNKIDSKLKRIGLRSLELKREQDKWGESFQFIVNNKPFFVKGTNWIPADTFVTRLCRDDYEYLIKSSADVHMNMIRVWGGGIYEDDVFYDLCDEYGLCVWQDFMFACSAYPAFSKEFMDNVRIEAEQNVKRLRHHASLALWCGNNELEHLWDMFIGDSADGKMTREEYTSLFDKLLPEIVDKYDPGRAYWPSSSHSPVGERNNPGNPDCGDVHIWEVWHGRKPFEWFRTSEHRFITEFGFQSFPEPSTVNSFTQSKDKNITSYIMEHHQRSQIGNDAIIQYMLSWFQLPSNFDMLLWSSQILQGIAIKYAIEHWRVSAPRTMGALYWQLNDCWPSVSWSSIDYYGNWKALHYFARKFFAPLLISGIEDSKKGTVKINITSDLSYHKIGDFHWKLTNTHGEIIIENILEDVRITPNTTSEVCQLDFSKYLIEYGRHRLLLWLEMLVDNKVVSNNLIMFTRPKHLDLYDPEISTRISQSEQGEYTIIVKSKYPALWVWPDLSGLKVEYSDRFFHLFPEKPIKIIINPTDKIKIDDFKNRLKIYNLLDTWKTIER